MKLRSLLFKIKHLALLLRKKGVKYAYNFALFSLLYGTKNPFFIKLLHWFKSYPSYIEIEVSTNCNLRCIMCEHTYWREPNRDMSFEQFQRIVEQFPGLKWIGLTGIGESFLNKDFMKMLKFVKSKDIYVELYDTFYFIDKDTAKKLIELEIDRIFASIDAASKQTYERIRINSDFDRVINNVQALFQLKSQMQAYFPEVVFHYIINKANLQEIPQYIELAWSLAKGEKVVVQFSRMLHKFKEVEGLFVEIPQEIIQAAEDKAKRLGVGLSWNADVPRAKPPIANCTEWIMPFIFVSGHVIACCSANEAGCRDSQKATSLGNVFEDDFKKIWQSEKYAELRRMLRNNEVPLPCKNCCIYDTKNKKR